MFEDITEKIIATRTIQSEKEKLQAFINILTSTDIGINIVNNNFEIEFQNLTLEQRFGSINKNPCYEKFFKQKCPCSFCPMNETRNTFNVERFELMGIDLRNYELICAPILNPNESIEKVVEILVDTTEIKRKEKKIEESEKILQAIADHSSVGISIIQDEKVIYVNKIALDRTGILREEINNYTLKDSFNIVHPDDREIFLKILKEHQAGVVPSATNATYRVMSRNGRVTGLDSYITSIYYNNKVASMSISIDITDRIKKEKELKDSEEKYRHLFDKSPIGLLLFDINGVLIRGNTAVFDMFQDFPPELSMGKNILEIISQFKNYNELRDIFINKSIAWKQGKEGGPMEFRVIRKDGKERWFHWESSMIHLENQEIIQSIIIDITKRKELEELILEENKKLQDINEIKEELIRRISHELKTPITSTYGASQALLRTHRNDMNQIVQDYIKIIHRGNKRLKSLVENLLDIVKIESRVFTLQLKEENLSKIIVNSIKDLKFHALDRDVNIYFDLPEELILKIDRIRISQVLNNILSNAINNNRPGGEVFIYINEDNDRVDIIVEDTGVGITTEEKQRLFKKFGKIERFGKGDNLYIEGSGLGLYISKQFVSLHGGEILVESEGRNKGAKFTIRLYKENKMIKI